MFRQAVLRDIQRDIGRILGNLSGQVENAFCQVCDPESGIGRFRVFSEYLNIGCRFSGRQRGGHLIRAGMAAGAGLSRSCFLARVASRAHFALFSGANSDPLKTPPSHGFIDLDAIKSVAKRAAAFRGCGIPRISLFFAREPTP